MQDREELIAALARSEFRCRQRLGAREWALLREKSLDVILEHGRRFVVERLGAAEPERDGRQTPMRGHPVFVAQHATATCCRGCLGKWHNVDKGRPLSDEEVEYVLGVIEAWLKQQGCETPSRVQGRFDWA